MNAPTIGAPSARVKTPSPDPKISDFRINGMAPFACHDEVAILEEAVSLLTVLAAAYSVAEAVDEATGDHLINMRPGILASALSGIGNLVALGSYFNEVHEHRRAQP